MPNPEVLTKAVNWLLEHGKISVTSDMWKDLDMALTGLGIKHTVLVSCWHLDRFGNWVNDYGNTVQFSL